MITWLLERSYQVKGLVQVVRASAQVGQSGHYLACHLESQGEVAQVPKPVTFVRPLQQYAVRTPSKEQASGFDAAVVATSRTDLSMTGVVEQ